MVLMAHPIHWAGVLESSNRFTRYVWMMLAKGPRPFTLSHGIFFRLSSSIIQWLIERCNDLEPTGCGQHSTLLSTITSNTNTNLRNLNSPHHRGKIPFPCGLKIKRSKSTASPMICISCSKQPEKKNAERCIQYSPSTIVGGWTNPFEKYTQVTLDHFPRDENKKIWMKPPPSRSQWLTVWRNP